MILQSEFDQASILLIGRLIICRQNAEEEEEEEVENLIAYMLDDGVLLLWRLLPFKFPARNKIKKKSLYGVVHQPCDTVVLIESIPSAVLCVYPPGI